MNDGVRLLVVPRPAGPCYIEVVLNNRSDRTVRLVGVQTGLGPAEDTTKLVVATDGGSGPPTRGGSESNTAGDPEATYGLDVELPPGEVYLTRVGLAFNDDYCNGSAINFQPWPSVLVEVGGHRYSVAASTGLTIEPRPDTPETGAGCSPTGG